MKWLYVDMYSYYEIGSIERTLKIIFSKSLHYSKINKVWKFFKDFLRKIKQTGISKKICFLMWDGNEWVKAYNLQKMYRAWVLEIQRIKFQQVCCVCVHVMHWRISISLHPVSNNVIFFFQTAKFWLIFHTFLKLSTEHTSRSASDLNRINFYDFLSRNILIHINVSFPITWTCDLSHMHRWHQADPWMSWTFRWRITGLVSTGSVHVLSGEILRDFAG